MRRQLAEQAVKLAVSGRWNEAAAVNREFLRLFEDETDALNRLGKALSELGRASEARSSYQRALELDPNNAIARRNLERLAGTPDAADAEREASQLDTSLFIEETGKAGVAALQAIDPKEAERLDAGDLVELVLQGKAVNVHRKAGGYVGMVEPRVGLRLARLIEGGNRYSAAVLSVNGDEVTVVLRETVQHPSQAGIVSFPQAKAAVVRAYTRRNLGREDVDYLDSDAEDADDDAPDGWTTEDEDDDDDSDRDTSGFLDIEGDRDEDDLS